MKRHIPTILFLIPILSILITFPGNLNALETDFSGTLSGWAMGNNNEDSWEHNVGVRYIPELSLTRDIDDDSFIDGDISLNGFLADSSDESTNDYDLSVYRAKLRYATAKSETRVGLQLMNFGPAQILRPLRWFDRIDPTDPLKLTEGVWALRYKYNTLNNAGLWIWGLYGNEDTKGYELMPTASGKPEFGGRFQYPVWDGELAATVHSRVVDGSSVNESDFTENRFAFDGRWDVGIGIWFETSFQHQDVSGIPFNWFTAATVGLDYTFAIGNGLYVLFEHMNTNFSKDLLGQDESVHFSSCLLNYPFGILDNLMAIGYYSWNKNEYSQYLSWQRAYDALQIVVSLFYHPESGTDMAEYNQSTAISGYGGQLMLIFNH